MYVERKRNIIYELMNGITEYIFFCIFTFKNFPNTLKNKKKCDLNLIGQVIEAGVAAALVKTLCEMGKTFLLSAP